MSGTYLNKVRKTIDDLNGKEFEIKDLCDGDYTHMYRYIGKLVMLNEVKLVRIKKNVVGGRRFKDSKVYKATRNKLFVTELEESKTDTRWQYSHLFPVPSFKVNSVYRHEGWKEIASA